MKRHGIGVELELPTRVDASRSPATSASPGCVAITGLDTFVGQRLADRLLALKDAPRVVGLDLRRPLRHEGHIVFHRVDLTDPSVGTRIAEIFSSEGVDAVAHLAFRSSPTTDLEYDHELETLGSFHVLSACAEADVARLVVASRCRIIGIQVLIVPGESIHVYTATYFNTLSFSKCYRCSSYSKSQN